MLVKTEAGTESVSRQPAAEACVWARDIVPVCTAAAEPAVHHQAVHMVLGVQSKREELHMSGAHNTAEEWMNIQIIFKCYDLDRNLIFLSKYTPCKRLNWLMNTTFFSLAEEIWESKKFWWHVVSSPQIPSAHHYMNKRTNQTGESVMPAGWYRECVWVSMKET